MGNFRRDTKGYHYTIPEAFDPSLSYDMQYQRLRNIVLKIIDEMEINVPYLIMTKVTHTNDSITITGSLYQDYKFVSLNNTFSLVGLGDGTYYLNLNNRHKYAPCDKDIVSVPFEGTMYVSTQYMPKDELTLYSITKENGVVTSVEYNDIYTGMHNIAEDAHENRFSDVYAKIQAEIDRATSAEETLDKKIEDETDRAETSESALDDKIETETQRATSAETQLQNNITAETNRATAKENELSAAITAEQHRAEQAEQQITNAVNTEVQNRTAAVTEERERAIAAENAITENMTNLVNTEKDRAIAAEASITENMTNLVNTEKDRAIAAETSITEDMTNLVDTEKNRAIAAEENLQSQFNNWEAQLDGVEAKVDAKQDKIGAVQGNATDMEITGIPATNSIAFKGENDDFLAIKTKNPTGENDTANKQYVDSTIENATTLNWKTGVLKFYEAPSSTEVANLNIEYAEDANFVYIYLSGSISNCKVLYAEADLDITPFAKPSDSSPITYYVYDVILSDTSFTTINNIMNTKYNISIGINGALDLTNKSMRIYGTYLFKK